MTYDDSPAGDMLPANPAAEVALLGAAVRAGRLDADIEALIEPDDFLDPHRAAVYAAIVGLSRKGQPCDYVAVLGQLDPVTTRAMNNGLRLIEFAEAAPVGGAAYHAQIVADVAERRRYITAGLKITQAARQGTDELADLARSAVDGVSRGGRHKQRPAFDVLAEILDPETVQGIPLGLADLDNVINPLLPGSITAIGARSGVGKTTFALDIMRRAVYHYGQRGLFVSIEQTDREIFTKTLSAEARVDHTKIMRGDDLLPHEEIRVSQAVNRIGNGELYVADVDSCSLADFRALVREYRPTIAAIDFLGMMKLPAADRHDLAIAETVYGIKAVSAAENCHTLVLSQFNRAADNRTDKRPHMGDFRDSAGLEHAAHLALLLHRPDLHDAEDRPGEVDVYIGKQRNGPAGHVIPLAAQLWYSQFTMLTQQVSSWKPDALDYTEPRGRDDES